MATKYWLKLYYEVLDDPKTARLPDNLWRRFFELCLLAGEAGYKDDDPQNGRVPSPSDMSWRLRVDEETLATELDSLARKGFIEYRADNVLDGYWFIPKFNERQRKMGKAEYMRRLREERGGVTPPLQPSYHPVTDGNADRDIDRDKIRLDGDDPISLFIAELVKVSSTPYWVKTEKEYEDTAFFLHGKDATAEQIQTFGEWWKQNSYYEDGNKATLKTIVGSWDNFLSGKQEKKKAADLWGNDISKFITGDKKFSELSDAGQKFVRDSGGNNLKQMRPNSYEYNQIKKEAMSYAQ